MINPLGQIAVIHASSHFGVPFAAIFWSLPENVTCNQFSN